MLIAARLAYPRLFVPATTATGLMLVTVASGGLVAWSDEAVWTAAIHVGAAAATLAAALVVVVLAARGMQVAAGPGATT